MFEQLFEQPLIRFISWVLASAIVTFFIWKEIKRRREF